MEEMTNKATDLADKIKPLVIVFGLLLAKFAVNKFISMAKGIGELSKKIRGFTGTTTALNKGLALTNTLLVAGIIYAIYEAVKAFREGDKAAGWLAVTMGVALVGAMVALNWEIIKTNAIKLWKWFDKVGDSVVESVWKWALSTKEVKKHTLTVQQVGVALGAMVASYFVADSIINSFSEDNRKAASTCFLVAGGLMAIAAAALAITGIVSPGKALIAGLAGIGSLTAGIKGLSQIKGYADGGYSNANLIMTHENGKREWVGKAAGSSAIVNDTQMSDIMEVAVAKGVYQALSARSAMGGNVPTNETIVVKIGEEAVFNAVRKTARRQGRDFANV
jgi:hypothetical protein